MFVIDEFIIWIDGKPINIIVKLHYNISIWQYYDDSRMYDSNYKQIYTKSDTKKIILK